MTHLRRRASTTAIAAICCACLIVAACSDPPGRDANAAAATPAGRIVPPEGYAWPEKEREYWPTEGWRVAPMAEHGLDAERMTRADRMASADPYSRALLVVKDGLVVFESYYNGGGRSASTEVWSVTKSFTSALVGIAIDHGKIASTQDSMADYLPDHPRFGAISIDDVLTHTTGLQWDEDSLTDWVLSDDWVAYALERGRVEQPGEVLLYSSGNSHFLSALLRAATGRTPGELADEHLFGPLGIELRRPQVPREPYASWEELHIPSPGTWRRDNRGLEIGAFGLHLTAREMAKLGFLYLNLGRWEGRQLVSTGWVRESTRDRVLRSENFGFGYQWVVSKVAGQLTFRADGWGGQFIAVAPSLDLVVVIKSDAEDPQGRIAVPLLEQVIGAATPSTVPNPATGTGTGADD